VSAGKSSAGKALLVAGGIIFVLLVLAIGGIAYGVHKVKSKLGYSAGAIGRRAAHANLSVKACSLLAREDLQEVLGVAIEKSSDIVEGSEPGCAYYTNAAAFAQLQRLAVEQARRDAEAVERQPAPKTDNPLELLKHTKEMEGIVKSLTLTQGDKEGRVFAFTVDTGFGRENWTTLRGAMSLVPGFDEVSGVGDRALVGSFGHAFYVLKGDSMIHLDLTSVPDARTRGGEIARRIAARM
jgi:hypothetical protein